MDLGLQGKRAFVAASSRGLGRAIAREFAQEGMALAICARNVEQLTALSGELVAAGAEQVSIQACDLSEPGAAETAVEQASSALGGVDVLVTNTGGPPAGPFASQGHEVWEQALNQNLHSVLGLCRAALPGMRAQRWGRILNVTSIAVKQPVDGLILSNSVRGAVTGFARTLANEVAADGVTVNNLLPGYTRTDRLDELATKMAEQGGSSPDQVRAGWEAQIPAGRLGEPEEFAALAAFLASTRAAYITGQSIPVDGGWVRSLY